MVSPLEPLEQGTGEKAEVAEVDHVAQVGAAGFAVVEVGLHRLENVDCLGADKHPLAGHAVGCCPRLRPAPGSISTLFGSGWAGSFGTVIW